MTNVYVMAFADTISSIDDRQCRRINGVRRPTGNANQVAMADAMCNNANVDNDNDAIMING